MKEKIKKITSNVLAKNRRQAGFTLIEMVVVIAIVVILILLIMPNLIGQKQKAESKTMSAFKTTVQTQVELYKDDKNADPSSFADLENSNYLTHDQVEKAKKNFTLENGNVKEKN